MTFFRSTLVRAFLGLFASALVAISSCWAQTSNELLFAQPTPEHEASIDNGSMQRNPPKIPYSEKERGVGGIVVLLVLVDRQGNPIAAGVEMTSGSTALDRSAVAAVGGWSIHPSEVDGVPRYRRLRVPVVFTLEGKPPQPSPLPKDSDRERWVNKTAFANLVKEADANDAEAQEELGNLLQGGFFLPPEHERALALLHKARDSMERAALAGDGHAAEKMAEYYLSDVFGPSDMSQATRWFHIAAIHGDEWAQAVMGYLYHSGRNVPQDDVLAYAWTALSRRTDQGNALITDIGEILNSLSTEQLSEAGVLTENWKLGEDIVRKTTK